MNYPELSSYEEQAIDIVTSVINGAKESLGDRQTLRQLANTRDSLAPPAKVSLSGLKQPLVASSQRLIAEVIEKRWQLTDTFHYMLKYMGASQDECSQHLYFEITYTVEGQYSQQDIRYVILTADQILAMLKMKLKFFQRIEKIRIF